MRVGNVQLSGPKSPERNTFGYPQFTELHFGCNRIAGMCEQWTKLFCIFWSILVTRFGLPLWKCERRFKQSYLSRSRNHLSCNLNSRACRLDILSCCPKSLRSFSTIHFDGAPSSTLGGDRHLRPLGFFNRKFNFQQLLFEAFSNIICNFGSVEV